MANNILHQVYVQENFDGNLESYLLEYEIQHAQSRSYLKKMFRRGEILLNQQRAFWNSDIQKGDAIQFLESKVDHTVYEFDLSVKYEDQNCAVVFKPGGLLVSGNQLKTLEKALPYNLEKSKAFDALHRPRVAHRIDYATCGLVVVAKTASFLRQIKTAFEDGEVKKEYSAMVVGDWPDEIKMIDTPIDDKSAITQFEKVKSIPSIHFGALSLLKIQLLTGRRHQIRKHTSELGYPILGDQIYAEPKQRLRGKGLFLCSQRIAFSLHKKVDVFTDCPPKFDKTLDRQAKMFEKKNGTD